MKKVLILIMLIMNHAFGQGVQVELSPKIPTAGERFELIFQIKMTGNRAPNITFQHEGLELLGKRSGGVSLNTSVINGRISTSKEITLSYSLLSKKPGIFSISDIKVEVDGNILNYAPFEIEILKERKEASGFFLIAMPSKTKIYLGEGIDVNYYLYFQSSLRITGETVEEFPKFQRFIKRFHNIQPTIEQATYNGAVYYRRIIYSARLYPEKTGELYLDPMKLTSQYYDTQRGLDSFGAFGAFGFSTGRAVQKTLSSKQVPITVLPVPNPPQDFTGLIGNHEFKLEAQQLKVLVNEPLEIKFVVEGPGALENFEGPKLFQHQLLEEFDNKSVITELNLSSARKTFNYTYLPKGAFQKNSEEKTFSVFDPQSGKFLTKKIIIPEIIVGGASLKSFSSGSQLNYEKGAFITGELSEDKMLAPYFLQTVPLSKKSWINLFLGILILAIGAEMIYRRFSKDGRLRYYYDICYSLKKNGPNYSALHKLIIPLNTNSMEDSLLNIIENSGLSKESKDYFKKLVEFSEKKSYGNQRINERFEYKENLFKELLGILKLK
jgi:hypothetical protein